MPSFSSSGWLTDRSPPTYIVTSLLDDDIDRLTEFYVSRGFPEVEVGYFVEEVNKELFLRYLILEGVPLRVSSVSLNIENIDLDDILDARGIEAALESQVIKGDLLDFDRLSREQNRLKELLFNQGFPVASVNFKVDQKNRVYFIINSGPSVEIGKIFIQGNIATLDKIVLRELEFDSGDIWSVEEFEKSTANLYQTGFFSSISIAPFDGVVDEKIEDVTVRVIERDSAKIGIGVSVNTEDGLHLKGELSDRNIAGSGNGVVLSIDGFLRDSGGGRIFDSGRIRAGFRQPDILGNDTELYSELFAHYSLEFRDEFSFDRVGFATELKLPISEHISSSFGFTAYLEDVFDVEEDVVIGLEDKGESLYSRVSFKLDADYRNDQYNPTKGQRFSILSYVSSESIGSEVNIFSFQLKHSLYFSIGRLVFANNIQYRLIDPFGDTETVPLSSRLFLGGRNSLRGFSPSSVGPRGELGNIVGGDRSIVNSSEVIVPIVDNLFGVLFLDLGQAFLINPGSFTGDSLGVDELRFSPGFGFRYKTPIGPFSAEYGVASDRQFGERFGRLYIGIGGAF